MAPSSFSGNGAMLRRYQRDGLAGLERRSGSGAPESDLTRRIEALGWFIPAARFFYFTTSKRRGALALAIRRAAALPRFPNGWKKATRAQLLARLNLPAAPACPEGLREELRKREMEQKSAVPHRVACQIVRSPAAAVRSYAFAAPVRDLVKMPIQAVLKRMAELDPTKACRISLELL